MQFTSKKYIMVFDIIVACGHRTPETKGKPRMLPL